MESIGLIGLILTIVCFIDYALSEKQVYPHEQERFHFEECPEGASAIKSKQGFPQKCLPHQLQICYEAANITVSAVESQTICCWNNKVDYFCCRGVAPENCPRYNDVTVVIRKERS